MRAHRCISNWRRQVLGRSRAIALHPSSSAYSFNSRAYESPILRQDLPDTPSCCLPHHPSVANEETARVIDGKSIAKAIRLRLASEVSRMKEAIGTSPGLGLVVLGSRRDSKTFIHIKSKACDQVGIATFVEELPEDSPEDEVFRVVSRLNADPLVHGIIVQLPLPQHLDEERIFNVISPEKDVDGFHPLNMGTLALKGKEPLFIPCAPKACIELLLRFGVEITGKRAVVLGRSKIGGLPISLLLQRHHATISTVNAFTANPEHITREGDIVIADVGVPNMVRGSWLKPGAVVVDMGSNHLLKNKGCLTSSTIVGDVCYEEAVQVASAITPVPGGLGPVAIAMLLSNTVDAANRAADRRHSY